MPRARRHSRKKRVKKRVRQSQQRYQLTILDRFNLRDLKVFNDRKEQLLKYYWDMYSELAYQRSQYHRELIEALNIAKQGPYDLSNWRRVLDYSYSMTPLSSRGSYVDPGGRFNIGNIDTTKFIPFPALYLARDEPTALAEKFTPKNTTDCPISDNELALRSEKSYSSVLVNGQIESIVDLNNRKALREFVSILKHITIPKYINTFAKKIGYPTTNSVTTIDELLRSLLDPNWRMYPMQFDVPANSQLFGHLIKSASIEAIVYPSGHTGESCIALYPHNLEKTSSYVEVAESPEDVKVKRLNSTTWRESV